MLLSRAMTDQPANVTSLPEPSRQKTYDTAETERLRSALIAYREAEDIGVPTLIMRIADTTKRSILDIPPSTLQRFLKPTPKKGSNKPSKTNAVSLAIYDEFLQALGDSDPVSTFGQNLSAFFHLPSEEPLSEIPDELAGIFDSTTDKLTDIFRINKPYPPEKVPYSRLVITPLPHSKFAKAREFVFNWDRSPSPREGDDTPRRAYDGVMVLSGASLFLCLKNVLTGTPRTYWLQQQLSEYLVGHGHEASWVIPSSADEPAAPVRPLEVAFHNSDSSS